MQNHCSSKKEMLISLLISLLPAVAFSLSQNDMPQPSAESGPRTNNLINVPRQQQAKTPTKKGIQYVLSAEHNRDFVEKCKSVCGGDASCEGMCDSLNDGIQAGGTQSSLDQITHQLMAGVPGLSKADLDAAREKFNADPAIPTATLHSPLLQNQGSFKAQLKKAAERISQKIASSHASLPPQEQEPVNLPSQLPSSRYNMLEPNVPPSNPSFLSSPDAALLGGGGGGGQQQQQQPQSLFSNTQQQQKTPSGLVNNWQFSQATSTRNQNQPALYSQNQQASASKPPMPNFPTLESWAQQQGDSQFTKQQQQQRFAGSSQFQGGSGINYQQQFSNQNAILPPRSPIPQRQPQQLQQQYPPGYSQPNHLNGGNNNQQQQYFGRNQPQQQQQGLQRFAPKINVPPTTLQTKHRQILPGGFQQKNLGFHQQQQQDIKGFDSFSPLSAAHHSRILNNGLQSPQQLSARQQQQFSQQPGGPQFQQQQQGGFLSSQLSQSQQYQPQQQQQQQPQQIPFSNSQFTPPSRFQMPAGTINSGQNQKFSFESGQHHQSQQLNKAQQQLQPLSLFGQPQIGQSFPLQQIGGVQGSQFGSNFARSIESFGGQFSSSAPPPGFGPQALLNNGGFAGNRQLMNGGAGGFGGNGGSFKIGFLQNGGFRG